MTYRKKGSECTCPACGTPLASEDEKCPRCNKIGESADGTYADPDAEDAAESASAEDIAAAQNAAIARSHVALIVNGKSMNGTLFHGVMIGVLALLCISTFRYGYDFLMFFGKIPRFGTIYTIYNGVMAFFSAYTLFAVCKAKPNGVYLLIYYALLCLFLTIGYLYVYGKIGDVGKIYLCAFGITAVLVFLVYVVFSLQIWRIFPLGSRRSHYYDTILFLAICVVQVVYFNHYLYAYTFSSFIRSLAGHGIAL